MDNKFNNSDSPVEFSSQQIREQRPQTGQTQPGLRPGQRPPTGPTPGPGQRPPIGPTPGPGQRPPIGPTPGPGQRPPTRPTPGPGQRPPIGPTPGLGRQPGSAPPDFTPQGPFTERGAGNQQQFRERFRGDMRTRPRDFYGCLNSFTYLWLINGNNFWFFPISIDRQFVIGFRWRRNRWEFDRINLNRIFFFSCF